MSVVFVRRLQRGCGLLFVHAIEGGLAICSWLPYKPPRMPGLQNRRGLVGPPIRQPPCDCPL